MSGTVVVVSNTRSARTHVRQQREDLQPGVIEIVHWPPQITTAVEAGPRVPTSGHLRVLCRVQACACSALPASAMCASPRASDWVGCACVIPATSLAVASQFYELRPGR